MMREARQQTGAPEKEQNDVSPPVAASLIRSHREIFFFWVPLAAQWIMMAAEGPFLAAVIARMGDPTFNLAAYGVAFALAILVESPVIMLMSAATALVEDAASYRRLRNFGMALNGASTVLLLLVLVPPVYRGLMVTLLALPDPVPELVRGSLWLLLPWPAAIGYRRFLHGVLIRSGRTRRVAYGTLLRLGGMAATAALLYAYGTLPGAWVGAAALSAGVCIEALSARIMAGGAIRELLAGGAATAAPGVAAGEPDTAAESGAGAEDLLAAETAPSPAPQPQGGLPAGTADSYGGISRFYFPLALTSLIGLTVHPMLTFFMGRAAAPVESLAVFPVVHALSFLFRAPGFSFQEAVIALAGARLENVNKLARFGTVLGFAASGGLALVAFTPLATVWFETVSGLPPALASFAVIPTRILVPLPAVAVLLAFQQALLVRGRTTKAITAATALEVVGIATLFIFFGWQIGMIGVSAAMLALLGGRLLATAYLFQRVRRMLANPRNQRSPA